MANVQPNPLRGGAGTKTRDAAGNKTVGDAWDGQQFFPCGRRVMCVRGQKGPFGTLIAMTLLATLHFSAVEPFIGPQTSYVSTVLAAILLVAVYRNMLRAWLTDPGIYPPHRFRFRRAEDLPASGVPPQPMSRQQFVIESGKRIKISYCHTCAVYKPPRTEHCIVSDACVPRFDHFCPWIGNVVGQRNYRYFFSFLLTGVVLAAYVLVAGILRIYFHASSDKHKDGAAFGASIFQTILALLGFGFLIGMVVFHTYLQCTNQTTFEQVNGLMRLINPYGKGADIFWQLMLARDRSKIPRNRTLNELVLHLEPLPASSGDDSDSASSDGIVDDVVATAEADQ